LCKGGRTLEAPRTSRRSPMTNEESLRDLEAEISGSHVLVTKEKYEYRLACEAVKSLNRIGIELANLNQTVSYMHHHIRGQA